MELNEATVEGKLIDEVLSDAIIIGDDRYEQSLFIIDEEIFFWDIHKIEDLTLESLQPMVNSIPQLMLIGIAPFTPQKQLYFLQNHIQVALLQQGIGCEVSSIAAACNTWNIVRSEQRKVCLALIRER